jgi:hypothetical protein
MTRLLLLFIANTHLSLCSVDFGDARPMLRRRRSSLIQDDDEETIQVNVNTETNKVARWPNASNTRPQQYNKPCPTTSSNDNIITVISIRLTKSWLMRLAGFVIGVVGYFCFFGFSQNRSIAHDMKNQERERSKESLMGLLPSRDYDRTILYVHVGKTGGVTLDKIFKSNCEWYMNTIKQACGHGLLKIPPVISHLTKRTIHMSMSTGDREFISDNATSFLFTVRNPIARAISSFNFEHLDNNKRLDSYTKHLKSIFYEKCFPTIEALAMVLKNGTWFNISKTIEIQDYRDPNITNTVDCYSLGLKTLVLGQGRVEQNIHLSLNYEFYASETIRKYPDREVLVVRTENLWDEIDRLNQALSESLVKYGVVYNATVLHDHTLTASQLTFINMKNHTHSHGSEVFKVKSGLSKEGTEILCCHLSKDIQAFEDECGISKSDKEKYNKEVVDTESSNGDLFSWAQWSNEKGCNVTIS